MARQVGQEVGRSRKRWLFPWGPDRGADRALRNTLRRTLTRSELFDVPESVRLREALARGDVATSEGVFFDGEFADVSVRALQPGLLWTLFVGGARAVRVLGDPAVDRLWRELMPASPQSGQTPLGERLPTASSLRSIALNHRPSACVGAQVGDVIFAAPRWLTYVARKVVISRHPGGADLVVEPRAFDQDGAAFQLPEETVRSVWAVAHRLLEALTPEGFEVRRSSVSLERLIYDASLEALRRRIELVRSAGGRFSQLGHRLDEHWAAAAGPLQHRWLRPAFAIGSLAPMLGGWLRRLNEAARERSPDARVPDGAELLGEPHTDGRLFTCLSSQRDVVRTEFWTGERWRELALTTDAVVIFPGRLAERVIGLEATRHRVLHSGAAAKGALNASLVIGIDGEPA